MSDLSPEDLLKQKEAELAAIQAEAVSFDTIKQEADKAERIARAEYEVKVAAARQKKYEIEGKAFDLNRKRRALQDEMTRLQEEAERKRREAEEAEEAEEDASKARGILAMERRWDAGTAGARWREWAKDYQIDAGHLITRNRRVILADVMGLGKTLSSIITCDMAKVATAQASKDFPFLGDEVKFPTLAKYLHLPTGIEYPYFTYKKAAQDYPDEYKLIPAGHTIKIINAVERPSGKRILYLCPSALIRNVQAEFRHWAPHRNVTFIGGLPKAQRDLVIEMLKDVDDFVLICNYEAWRKDSSLLDSIVDSGIDTIIADEAHILKEMKSNAWKGVKHIITEAKPDYIIPMTGTPILNRPQELFSLLNLILPDKFTYERDFLYAYCRQDDDGNWHFKPGGADRVFQQIGGNFLRRTKKDAGIVLPERTIIDHNLTVDATLYKHQAKAREQMAKYATILIDEERGQAITATAIVAMFTRLRQIETWPAGIKIKDSMTGEVKFELDVHESQKLDYICSRTPDSQGNYSGLVPDVVTDERVVVFSQFKEPLLELQRRLTKAGLKVALLIGDTSADERNRIARDFDRRYCSEDRSDNLYDVVLCNYKVGGVGLNLTAATQMVILDEEWNPGKREQAYDRIHRIGQTEPTTIHVIRNEGTIDDWLASIMERKEGLIDGFNAAADNAIDMEGFKDFLDKGGLK